MHPAEPIGVERADLRRVADGLTFPEAPRWRDGRLWFSDFFARRVLSVAPGRAAEVMVEVPGQPSGLGWTPEGELLVVSMTDKRLLVLRDGALHVRAELSAFMGGMANDMVVDAAGRAYVGNMGFDPTRGEPPTLANLVRVDPDGAVTIASPDMNFPNGSVITPDGRRLIIAESFANRLSAFDIAQDGSLSGRRVFAELGETMADGICLDAEGAVWVANPRGRALLRVFEGGRVDRIVQFEDRAPFACMLGGAERQTLYVCTNAPGAGRGPPALEGRIEALEVSVPGVGLP